MVWPAPDVAQLGRPVGGAHEQRHPRVTRLDHRRDGSWRRRCPTCTHDRGPAGREADAERAERGRALVEHDVHADPVVARERERERRRARARARRRRRCTPRAPTRRRARGERCGGVASGHRALIRGHECAVPPRSCSCPASRRRRRRGTRVGRRRARELRRASRSTCRCARRSRRPRRRSATRAAAAIYVGYSMGGRLCLRLALDRPELVRGARARERVAGHRRRRRATRARVESDEQLARARRARRRRRVPRAAGSRSRCSRAFPRDAPGLADRRAPAPREFLAHCLRVLGHGAMEPMWDRLPRARDAGAARHRHARREVRPRSRAACSSGMPRRRRAHVRLDGGHALPLEQPAVLGGFDRRVRGRSTASRSPQADREQHARARVGSARCRRARRRATADRGGCSTSRDGRDRERRRERARAAPTGARTPQRDHRDQRTDDARDVEQPGAGRADAHGERALARDDVGRRRRGRCWRAGSPHAGSPTASAPHHAAAGHASRAARTRCRPSRRTRRTRAPSPRRARCSRTASGPPV